MPLLARHESVQFGEGGGFLTEGFEIVGNEGHTVFVKPKGSRTHLLHLCGPCDAWGTEKPGGRAGIWFQCGDITIRKDAKTGQVPPSSKPENVEMTYSEVKRNGVEFSEHLTTTEWGKDAIFRDPDGNEFELS